MSKRQIRKNLYICGIVNKYYHSFGKFLNFIINVSNMSENIQETIKEIKKNLRLSMNGVISAYQRRQGLNYKINFGVEIPRIKQLAEMYEKNSELSEELFKENIRECKLLAIFLYPQKEFTSEKAEKWISECKYTETVDHLCHKLLANMPNAVEKALQWIVRNEDMFRYAGFSLLSNFFRKKQTLSGENEKQYAKALKKSLCDNKHENMSIQNAASASLIRYTDISKEKQQEIYSLIKSQGIIPKESILNSLMEELENAKE